jgi:DNA transformation protein
MSVSQDFLFYVVDQLAAFGKVATRRMFGGVGLYADNRFFALIDDDMLYFKVDGSNRPDYLTRGSEPFRPMKNKPDAPSLNYFRVPDEVLEEPEELKLWARKSVSIASVSGPRSRQVARTKRIRRKAPLSS